MKKLLICLFLLSYALTAFGINMTLHFADGHIDTVAMPHDTQLYFSDSSMSVTRLVAPANAAVDVPQQPEFSWRYVPGRQVELLISKRSDFADTLIHVTGIDTNAYRLEESLEIQNRYYWKVRIEDEALWTAAWYFNTYEPVLPEKLESLVLMPADDPGTLQFRVSHDSQIDSFLVIYGFNAGHLSDSCYANITDRVISGLDPDSCYYVKIAGVNGAGIGPMSELLASSVSTLEDPVLIVNGFDRQTIGNSKDFIRQHAEALLELGYTFISATNEAMTDGLLSFPFYSALIYILGEESTADETFSDTEQDIIEAYLKAGGKMFISGAEIAWDLDYKGSSSDKAFCHNYLHLAYKQDAPNNATGTYYNVYALGDTIFSDLSSFAFDNGTHGTYNVRYPDVFTPQNDAQAFLKYTGCNTGAAGIVYQGVFPGGSTEGKIMVLGFPLETVYPEAARTAILGEFFEFAEQGLAVEDMAIPKEHRLLPNYPNPFNPSTAISYQLSEAANVDLTIFDLSGKRIETLVSRIQSAGTYELIWDASVYTSGIYFAVFKVDGGVIGTRKMTLVK
jgi:hypothetical protein